MDADDITRESKDAPLSTTKRRLLEAKRQDFIIEEDFKTAESQQITRNISVSVVNDAVSQVLGTLANFPSQQLFRADAKDAK